MRKIKYAFDEQTQERKRIELIDFLSSVKEWKRAENKPQDFKDITYLGKCDVDGDMFACVSHCGQIIIYKGHLNDGTW